MSPKSTHLYTLSKYLEMYYVNKTEYCSSCPEWTSYYVTRLARLRQAICRQVECPGFLMRGSPSQWLKKFKYKKGIRDNCWQMRNRQFLFCLVNQEIMNVGTVTATGDKHWPL
jgi:hypothetical protein